MRVNPWSRDDIRSRAKLDPQDRQILGLFWRKAPFLTGHFSVSLGPMRGSAESLMKSTLIMNLEGSRRRVHEVASEVVMSQTRSDPGRIELRNFLKLPGEIFGRPGR